jgi:hypothetical protein
MREMGRADYNNSDQNVIRISRVALFVPAPERRVVYHPLWGWLVIRASSDY